MSKFLCLPKDWREVAVGTVADVIDPHPSHRAPNEDPLGIPFAGIGDLDEYGRVREDKVRKVSHEIFEEHIKRYKITDNSIGFGRVASLGKIIDFKVFKRKVTISPTMAIVEPRGGMSKSFLIHCLRSQETEGQINFFLTGSTRSSLGIALLRNLLVPEPPLPEQKKIAAILSSVDEVIEKTRAQIDKLKDLKTGMMQELLTKGIGPGGVPHTEFKDSPVGRIPAGWEVSPLNQLVTIKHGYAFEGAYFRSVPTPYLLLTPGNFNKDGRLYFGPKTKYYDGPVPEDFILKNGDVLVVMTDLTKEMTILGNTIILKSPNTVLHNQRIGKVVSLKENILLPDYLCMIMNSDRVKSHIKDTATGTTVRHTSPTKILEPLIPIPSISEQAKIADIFRALNDKVALVESKLAAHEIIKKALMQDLLTGKVRVQVDTRELADA